MQPLPDCEPIPFNVQRQEDIESCNSVHVVKTKEGCLCTSHYKYTVYSSQTMTPILCLETESCFQKMCKCCSTFTVHISSLTQVKKEIGTYTPPCCASLTCKNGLRTKLNGRYVGGIQNVFHKCMFLCMCPNYMYEILDSTDKRQYVITNNVECKCLCYDCTGCCDCFKCKCPCSVCCAECIRCKNCNCKCCCQCCSEETLQRIYDIHEKSPEIKPTGGFLVNYTLKHCCCCIKHLLPTFDIDFPPNTPREEKLNILAFCAYF